MKCLVVRLDEYPAAWYVHDEIVRWLSKLLCEGLIIFV